jgi:hypothetical protein
MVGPPAEGELCLEAVKIEVKWWMATARPKPVPIQFSDSPRSYSVRDCRPRLLPPGSAQFGGGSPLLA